MYRTTIHYSFINIDDFEQAMFVMYFYNKPDVFEIRDNQVWVPVTGRVYAWSYEIDECL